jgi:hypothetical protein
MSGRTGSNNHWQYTDAVEFGRAGRGKARQGKGARGGKGREGMLQAGETGERSREHNEKTGGEISPVRAEVQLEVQQ